MKFLVIWRIEINRLSGELMKSVLRMRDYALPLEQQGMVRSARELLGQQVAGFVG